MRNFIGCVLDRSGSMEMDGKIGEALGGFNRFLREQKAAVPDAEIVVTIFDDKIEDVYSGKIEDCPELTSKVFFARGMTMLNDAIGSTISKIVSLSDQEEDKAIILVITDGLENASMEYNGEKIKSMIEEGKNKGWEFIFLGCDEATIGKAQNMGFVSMEFDNSAVGIRSAYASISESSIAYFTQQKNEEP